MARIDALGRAGCISIGSPGDRCWRSLAADRPISAEARLRFAVESGDAGTHGCVRPRAGDRMPECSLSPCSNIAKSWRNPTRVFRVSDVPPAKGVFFAVVVQKRTPKRNDPSRHSEPRARNLGVRAPGFLGSLGMTCSAKMRKAVDQGSKSYVVLRLRAS